MGAKTGVRSNGSVSRKPHLGRVLVATDGSIAALRGCEMLAFMCEPRAEVRLLTVLSFDIYPYSQVADGTTESDERMAAADVQVLGRRGLTGPARWLGSVSEHVLHRTRAPILLVA